MNFYKEEQPMLPSVRNQCLDSLLAVKYQQWERQGVKHLGHCLAAFGIFLLLFAEMGCIQKPASSSTSDLGRLSDNRSTWPFPLAKYVNLIGHTPLSCVDGQDEPLAISYLRKIGKKLMEANPEIFQGPFAPENFCFQVGAWDMQDPLGDIIISDVTIKNSKNDAEIAHIMAHEIVHVLTSYHMHERQLKDQKSLDLVEELLALDIEKRDVFQQVADEHLATIELTWQKTQPVLQKAIGLIENEEKRQLADNDFSVCTQSIDLCRENTRVKTRKMESLLYACSNFMNYLEVDKIDGSEDKTLLEQMDTKLQEIQGKINTQLAAITERQTLLISEQERRQAELFAEAPAISEVESTTWWENLADEGGTELFLRAKFDKNMADAFVRHELEARRDTNYLTLAECETLLSEGKIPERGYSPFGHLDSHPASCWRMYNIRKLLKSRELDPFAAGAVNSTVFPGELQKVIDSLNRK